MRYISLLILLLLPSIMIGEIIVIHEKLIDDQWVMGRTIVPDDTDLDGVYGDITTDPAKRMGDAFVIFGGTRLAIEEVEESGPMVWDSIPNPGEVIVFWNVTGSTNPADFYSEKFASITTAQTFIDMAMLDPGISLWDNRPFFVTQEYVRVQDEPAIRYVLTQP